MGNFNAIACYSAIKELRNSNNDLVTAYARLVSHIIYENSEKKSYDIKTLINDIKDKYSLDIPYHPMQTILDKCRKLGYISIVNGKIVSLNSENDDEEIFLPIYEAKEKQFKKLLRKYIDFLSNEYQEYISEQEAYKQIDEFLENSDLTFVDDNNRVYNQHEYRLAEFLIQCNNEGCTEYIDILNDYIVGAALIQLLTFQEKIDNFIFKNLVVYIDTPIIFRLLGIDSLKRTQIYIDLIKQMQRNGIKVKAYDHTVNEVSCIIEDAKYWVNNIEFDTSLANETSLFFVENNWSKTDIDQLSLSVNNKLENELNISIDKSPYPLSSDIRTISQAEIKDLIKQEYQNNVSNETIVNKDQTIELDAQSLFLTMHKSKGIVAHNVNDLRFLFLTTNRTLAKIGRSISKKYLHAGEAFFPIAMDDVKWGTIIWFDTPNNISNFSRSKLIAAAYASFRPSPAVIKKFNTTLVQALKNNQITNEECYLMRTKSEIETILLKLTNNDEVNCIESTPLEVMNQIRDQGYKLGISEKNEEIESLKLENINLEREKNDKIASLKDEKAEVEFERRSEMMRADIAEKRLLLKEKKDAKKEIDEELNRLKNDISIENEKDEKSKKLANTLSILLRVLLALLIIFVFIKISKNYFNCKDQVDTIISIIIFFATFLIPEIRITGTKLSEKLIVMIRKYSDKHYKLDTSLKPTLIEKIDICNQKINELTQEIDTLKTEIDTLEKEKRIICV